MKQIGLLAMTLVLTAAALAGCGCTNQRTESTSAPTVLPTNEENWTTESTGSAAETSGTTHSTAETQSTTAATAEAAGASTAEGEMDETTEAARNAHRPRE